VKKRGARNKTKTKKTKKTKRRERKTHFFIRIEERKGRNSTFSYHVEDEKSGRKFEGVAGPSGMPVSDIAIIR
jgi:hypothetical protein